uniref:Uncharacterized protein n=1 Tax=Glossina pallidipes TaxID=7398 RepID=A0A240SX68_GLOPL
MLPPRFVTLKFLYVFLNFQYDNMSMDLMLREGLIMFLIKELQSFINSVEEYYKRKREEQLQSTKKRKLAESVKETKCKFPKVHEDVNLDYDSPSGSSRSLISSLIPCRTCIRVFNYLMLRHHLNLMETAD